MLSLVTILILVNSVSAQRRNGRRMGIGGIIAGAVIGMIIPLASTLESLGVIQHICSYLCRPILTMHILLVCSPYSCAEGSPNRH